MVNKIIIISVLAVVCLILCFKNAVLSHTMDMILNNDVFINKMIDKMSDGYKSPYGPGEESWMNHLNKMSK